MGQGTSFGLGLTQALGGQVAADPASSGGRFAPVLRAARDGSDAGHATRLARWRAQPAHARLFASFVAGGEDAELQTGLAGGVRLRVLPTSADAASWSRWRDGQAPAADDSLDAGEETDGVTTDDDGDAGKGAAEAAGSSGFSGPDRGGIALYTPEEPRHDTYIYFVHGGAFEYYCPISGGYDSLCSRIAAATSITVACPDHALSGEGRSHKGRDIIASLAADLMRLMRLDPVSGRERSLGSVSVVLAGDSSGANQALGLLLHLLQSHPEVMPSIRGVALLSPWLDLTCGSHTYVSNSFSEQHHTGDILFREPAEQNRKTFLEYSNNYVGGDKSLLKDPILSPYWLARGVDASLLADLERAEVPIWMCVGAAEALSGEVLDFAQRLRNRLRLEVWQHEGMFHDWLMYRSENLPFPSKEANLQNLVSFVRRVLLTVPELNLGIHYYIDAWSGDGMDNDDEEGEEPEEEEETEGEGDEE
ncbi:unnamed protein product, partial [Polarella glacialis]